MIIFIYGPDTFRSRQYLGQSIEQFKKTRDPQGYNVVRLDGTKDEPGKILTELKSAPFLAEKRMVVIENILARKDDETLETMAQWIKDKKIPESTVAIFWQGEAVGKSKAVKALQTLLAKEKYAREFTPLSGAGLADWLRKEVAARGGSATPEAVQFLTANAPDLWALNSLVDQLVAYAKGAAVTPAMAQLFMEVKLDDNVFSLVDAIVNSNRKKSLQLLEHQRALGEEDGKIFGLVVWQFRILLELGDLLERDSALTSDTLAKRTGLNPFVVRKNIAVARSTSLARLQEIYQQLLTLDRQTKTGVAPQNLLVDLFVAR